MNKIIIGMVHLQALPTSPDAKYSLDKIYDFALKDLEALEKGGATHAIVENFFDTPYDTDLTQEVIVAYTHLFTRLKLVSKIPLGVNIHACSNDEEMIIASLCNADFIRAESFVEARHTGSGILKPMSAKLTRKRKTLNSKVKIFSDINVKESYAFSPQTAQEAINDALKAKADAIILTGLETGKAPSKKDAKNIKPFVSSVPLLIGSGVNQENIKGLLEYADGVIVGSSIKTDKDINKNVSEELVRELINAL